MNSQEYTEIAKKIGEKHNRFFEQFCLSYPEYQTISKDYLRKETHLNGVQFYAGFISGENQNWEDHIEVSIAIEMVMLWAYKTNRILDRKQETWATEENLKNTTLEHDLMLACIYSLLEAYSRKNIGHNEQVKDIINHLLGRMAYGFWRERSIMVKYQKLEDILVDWENKYLDRNINFNLVYDYAPLVGYALSSNDLSIIDKYEKEIDPSSRFSSAGQIINDLGDFGTDVDTHVKVYQDLFSDIRNSIVTFPVHALIKEKIVQKALHKPKITHSRIWQWRMRRLVTKNNLNTTILSISEKAYYTHKDFYDKYISNPNPLLLKVYRMLVNNKYFDQRTIRKESTVFRSQVILCDIRGKTLGTYDKLLAHKEGKLHKAFSIFVYNKNGELLIQQRAKHKYHSGGIWANTCCSHYVSSENVSNTAHYRLKEEMGFDCKLRKRFSFVYDLNVSNGMREHEFDTVFEGKYDGPIKPNPEEIESYRWISIEDLQKEIQENPEIYAPWFKKILERMGLVR